jgi:hypothetical protein
MQSDKYRNVERNNLEGDIDDEEDTIGIASIFLHPIVPAD